ncbi:hypothetical protein EW093_01000 [Thiospirochaeta perfilievii]|uniref:Uncharacterized protein n=1 Tax=Thiospirochaeta perfilievii TaxID=252967 RepID=A0A5C1Q8H2_9SPIO|nr:hypothetical protein [Thiospirochaeta perfilievii]QEN03340.1 hypothetical protein EW093_01000 [Thiospirochaeta perfilievii]
MKYWIIKHVETNTDFELRNSYRFNSILKSLIISEADTLFVAILNDQMKLSNLHLFPFKGLDSFKSQLNKIGVLSSVDKAAYISLAYNVRPKSTNLGSEYKKAFDKIITEGGKNSVPVWTALHCVDGRYTEIYQATEE